MASTVESGAFLNAFLDVIFRKLASPQVVDFIRRKLDPELLTRLEEILIDGKGVLPDAERKQTTDPAVKEWLDELKHSVYMVDDLLEEVCTKAATQKEVSNWFFGLFIRKDREMISRFEGLVDRLERIFKLKNIFRLKVIATENLPYRIPSTPLQPSSRMYGRDEDKNALIKLMLAANDESERVSVIPIAGLGGVGKTTLAQMVYNADLIDFDLKAWVCVSDEFDILAVTKSIFEFVTQSSCEINDLNLLQIDLQNRLKGRKFLIVLDDVWPVSSDDWTLLITPFQDGVRGSTILVTTRSGALASIIQTTLAYHLKPLLDEDCWSVFASHASFYSLALPSERSMLLENIGRMIAEKCHGLPLAAESLGRLLRRKHDTKYWSAVLNSPIWEVSENSIIPSLRISYDYLPLDFKRCFVHCSLFPKNYEFMKDELILLWMAEDLLPPPGSGKTQKEVGDECFEYLLASSFIHRVNTKWCECFKMHSLMHDLAIFLGGEFYCGIGGSRVETTISVKTRHFRGPLFQSIEVSDSAKSLRTLLLTKCDNASVEHLELLKLKHLRVLSFHPSRRLIALPHSIGELIYLRYLDLSCSSITSLPESLSNLYNLQTLKVTCCYELTMLPSGMQNLVNLCHLGIDDTPIKEIPTGMSKLTQLQHLPYFIVDKHEENTIKELGRLSSLHGSFSIRKLENVANGSEASEARMMNKKQISNLVLDWSSGEDFIDFETKMDILCKLEPHHNLQSLKINGYRGKRFPDWIGNSNFYNMTSLTLSSCENCCMLPSLGHLVSLKHLSISDLNVLETIDASFFVGKDSSSLALFPSLECLKFARMPCWEMWRSSFLPCVFPQLKCLTIKHCPKLRGDLPSHLPALEELKIKDCQQLACSLPRTPALGKLVIEDCSSVMSFPEGCLPELLKTLSIIEARNVEFPKQQPKHRVLESLKIRSSCDSLTSLPLGIFPNLKDLFIKDCENLESISQDVSFPNMISLKIYNCPALVSLAREGLAAPSLIEFTVAHCYKLKYLPGGMNSLLSKLELLNIENCPRIESFPEKGMLPSLREIDIANCEKLLSTSLAWPSMDMVNHVRIKGPCDAISFFPKEALLPPSILSLSLHELPNLETLDCKGLLHLSSLHKLRISSCPKLKNMEGEWLPASLTELLIYDCPLLGEQCRMRHPQIWPKISHISHIQVDLEEIS